MRFDILNYERAGYTQGTLGALLVEALETDWSKPGGILLLAEVGLNYLQAHAPTLLVCVYSVHF